MIAEGGGEARQQGVKASHAVPGGWLKKRTPVALLVLFAGAALVPVLVASGDGLARLEGVALPDLGLLLLGVLLVWVSRVCITLALIQPFVAMRPSFSRLFLIEMTVNFSSVVTPFGAGGVFAAFALVKPYGISSHRIIAMFVISRFVDAFFLLSFLLLTLSTIILYTSGFSSDRPLMVIVILCLASLVAVWVGMASFMAFPRLALVAISHLARCFRLSKRNFYRIASLTIRTHRAVREFSGFSAARKSAIFLMAAVHWCLASFTLWLSIRAVGGDIDWDKTVAVQVLSVAGGKIAALPGGAMGAEVAAIGLLIPAAGAGVAGASVLLWRLATFYLPLMLGGLSFLFLSRHMAVWASNKNAS